MRNRVKYIELPVAYDVETTSYRDNGEKAAIVYTHTVSVDGEVSIFRSWVEFYDFLQKFVNDYDVNLYNRVVIYVHNLGYEFGFLRRYFNWEEVAAIGSAHRIARAVTVNGIEFRCSYLLTNTGLAHVGEEVNVTKMIGDLDYDLMRHGETELSEEEVGYIVNDVEIIIALIRRRMERDGGIRSIPMTKTGYVRRAVRRATRADKNYKKLIQSMPLTKTDYTMARSAFQGGYTHANATYVGEVVNDVTGIDFSSCYPAWMIAGLFPMSPFVEVNNPSLEKLDALFGKVTMLVDVTLKGLSSRYPFPPISESKAITSKNVTADNGRVFSADEVRIIVTDVDFKVILRAYDIDYISVNNIRAAESGHLPRALGDAVLRYYGEKTKLKGVEGREEDYTAAKENTNSIFGMVATDPVREQFRFDNDLMEMIELEVSVDESLEEHNTSNSRFLYYPWACWITAYSRSALLNAIYDLIDRGFTVLYCDTDSIYFISNPEANKLIEALNDSIISQLTTYFDKGETADEIDAILSPKTIKGEKKTLGIFELDGVYDRFKALGAKRYAVEKVIDGETRFLITVSGLSKNAGDHKNQSGEWTKGYVSINGGMDFFKDGMAIPKEHSGRLVHTYSDEHVKNKMIDHNGVVSEVEQIGFVHLEAVDYRLSLSPDFTDFIQSIRGEGKGL